MFKRKNQVNVIKLQGVISATGRKSLSLSNIKDNIDKAFANKNIKAVAILINSPGGSPVQSEMIANYILSKSQCTNIPVITFVEDVAASGGYWLALVGDMIFALSHTSIVGSLGVVYASFGLEELIKRHGISRRVHTAGTRKVSLDIFQPEKTEDIARLQKMLAEIHQHFKNWVLLRRSAKINMAEDELFSGDFWIASTGLKYGLIDEITPSLEDKVQNLYGKKVKIKYITTKKSFLSSLFNTKNNLAEDLLTTLKTSLYWDKVGL